MPSRTVDVQYRPDIIDPSAWSLPGSPRRHRRRGFSLVEMLVVIVIMILLMGAANVLMHSPVSRVAEPASRLARCIELARAQAVAGNRNVALRFDAPDAGGRERVLRFLAVRPGEPLASGRYEFRRPEKFADIRIAASSELSLKGEALPDAHDLGEKESLVVTPDGQVFVGTGSDGFPTASEEMVGYIQIGVQPTFGGKVRAASTRDFALIQIQCASGSVRMIQP